MSDHEPVTTSERLAATVMEAVTHQQSRGEQWVELDPAVARRVARQLRAVETDNAALAAQVDRLERERRAAVEDLTDTRARLEDIESAVTAATSNLEAERRSAVATRAANRLGVLWAR